MFKRILVPVDSSPASLAGLHTAIALARDQKARLRLVHLAKTIPARRRKAEGMTGAELFQAIREQGNRFLERQAALCRARRVPTETAESGSGSSRAMARSCPGAEGVARRVGVR